MSDFVSPFWSWFIIIPTVVGLIWCLVLLLGNAEKSGEGTAMAHVWDENLQEYNNPLPRWWLYMFIGTVVFAFIYLALYPGLGTFKGMFGWTAVNQYEKEIQAGEEKYGPIFAKFAQTPIEELARDPEAMKAGERLFASYCTVCHGSDARGGDEGNGFPNLRDSDWLWGGSPDQIKQTITAGRKANMPVRGGLPLTDEEVNDVAEYVISLSRPGQADAAAAEKGKAVFGKICIACHGPTGTGNPAMGAPNLTDDTWLYGGSKRAILETINGGRNGVMPAHGEFLGEDKVHLLAAYIYGLANQAGK